MICEHPATTNPQNRVAQIDLKPIPESFQSSTLWSAQNPHTLNPNPQPLAKIETAVGSREFRPPKHDARNSETGARFAREHCNKDGGPLTGGLGTRILLFTVFLCVYLYTHIYFLFLSSECHKIRQHTT